MITERDFKQYPITMEEAQADLIQKCSKYNPATDWQALMKAMEHRTIKRQSYGIKAQDCPEDCTRCTKCLEANNKLTKKEMIKIC